MAERFKYLIACVLICASSSLLAQATIVLNEISQGPSGGKEFIEFVVIPTTPLPVCGTPPCLDLRLWVFDDNNGYLNGSPTVGVGIADGACRFANDPFWSCIPAGTIITIYNDADPNTSMPPDDVSMADLNCTLVIPISSGLFEHHPTQPNATTSTYPTTGWLPGGDWLDISMANGQDGFQVFNPANLVTPVSSLGWGAANINGNIWMGNGSATDDVFYMTGGADCDWNNQANWAQGCAGDIVACGSDDQTPGAPNTTANANCIAMMNNSCGPPMNPDTTLTNLLCNGVCTGDAAVTVTGGTPGYSFLWSTGNTTQTLSGLCAGTYFVTVTDTFGCDTTTSVTITEPILLTVTLSGTPTTCSACNGSASATASGGVTPYSYQWSTGCSTASCNNLCAGVYNLTVTDANGCTATGTYSVSTTVTTFTINNSSVPVSCNGSCDASVTVTPSGGNPPYNYIWSTGGNAATETNLCAGTATVTITDALGCDTAVSVTVTEPALLTVSLSGTSTTCTSCIGSASASAAGGVTPYSYQWSTGCSTASCNNLCAGVYNLTVTDANGCTATGTYSVSTTVTTFTINNSSVPVSCNGSCDGSATVTPSSGNPPYSYTWSTGGNAATETNLCAGTATVTITDALGCDTAVSVTVTEPALLTVTLSGTPTTCTACNGSASATASGGVTPYTYQWSTGCSTASCNNLCAGIFDLTVTDAMGCTVTGSYTVITTGSLSASIGASTNASCNGLCDGSATVTPSGGNPPYSYTWSSGGNSATESGLCAGTSNVTVSDAFGCTAFATATITEPTMLNTTITSTGVSCNGGNDGTATAMSSGGTPGYSYFWSNGAATSTATGLSAAVFTVTATDLMGCTATASITISEPTLLSASIPTTTAVSCFGSSDGTSAAQAGGGTTPYTWLWSNGSTSATASGLSSGVVSVTVTDALGCSATATGTINSPPVLGMAFQAFDETCSGACDGQGIVIPSGGTTPYSYLWSSGGNTPSESNLCNGSYVLTVTDAMGCTVDTAFVINAATAINTSVSPTMPSCNGICDGLADLVVTGGNTPYGFQWSNGAITEDLNGICAGNFDVTVTDASGCTALSSVTITEPPPVLLTTTPDDTVCSGQSTLITAMATGGTTPYTYQWDQGLPAGAAQNVTPSSLTCYTVTATDANGCSASPATVCIDIFPGLSITTSGDDSICPGEQVMINASASGGTGGPYTYSWQGLGNGSSQTFVPQGNPVTQSYTVTAGDGCSTPVTDIVNIAFYSLPSPSFSASVLSGCEPMSTVFSNNTQSQTTSCSWDLGNGQQYSGCGPLTTTYNAGSYDVTLSVISAGGCSATVTVPAYINVYPNPQAIFSHTPPLVDILNPRYSFIDLSQGAIYLWQWSFFDQGGSVLGGSDQQNPSFTFPSDTGWYPVQLQVLTANGCSDDTTLYVYVDGIFEIWVPNAFTPDGDGRNDYFFPKGVGISRDGYSFYIFDRWGEMIFETHDLDEYWDGTARRLGGSEMVQNGVYVWVIEATEATVKKEVHKLIGHVSVVR